MQGVLLDVDGTLVLSNDAHAESWVEAFAHFGHHITFAQVRPLIGTGGDKLIPALQPGLNDKSGDGKKIAEFRTELFLDKYAKKLKPAPGSRRLVQKLLQNDFKLVVVTSAKPEELKATLKAAQVDDLLHTTTSASDADESKPDPDIVKAALKKIGLRPEQILMIGDTPYDIEAADKCGIRTIAFRCGGWNDKDLKEAVVIYNDPADLLANYSSSPLAQSL